MKKSDIDGYVSERTRGRRVTARYILVRLAGRISAQLDALRREQDLSQQDLADLAGTSKAQVNRLLSGDYTGITTTSLCRVAAALGCDVDVHIRPVPRKTVPREKRPPVELITFRGAGLRRGVDLDHTAALGDHTEADERPGRRGTGSRTRSSPR